MRFAKIQIIIIIIHIKLIYMRAVAQIRVKNNEKLQAILTQATIMIVSVTASTTQGQVLLIVCL